MKPLLAILVVFSLVLTGCNLPQEPTVNPTSLSTIVSGALTASATFSPPQKTTQPPATQTKPQLTPSLTKVPITATSPATATLTRTATSTATPESSDPKASLGKATWEDKFHDGGNWGLVGEAYDDGSTRVEIKNDSLYFLSKKGQGWHGWRATYPEPRNFYLEAVVHNINCGTGDYYGILFRATDDFNGYWFGVSCQGKFNLRTGGIGAWKEPVPAESNTTILSGPNKTNRLGVLAKGNRITLYINGKMVKDVTDNTYPNAGTFGMFIVGWNPNFAFETEEMAYWELP